MATSTKSISPFPLLPVLLTSSAFVLFATIALVFGPAIAALCAVSLPVPLVLLWTGRDVPAPLERIAAVDAERARGRAPVPSTAGDVETARAA